ncbi:hypothetical protein ACQZ28_02525 [Neisseria meningitidis]|uniref:hypothetical protein n=1 Tax=Neisseria meningitidis TaxID=487 RepID=UPI001EDDA250|nr:hypothetical protein [Neisseria meningitidis]
MKFEVFNKRPSKKAVKEAMKCSDVQEQMETLAIGTAPKKGEIWKSPNGRVVLIKSDDIVIHNADGDSFAKCYGVIAADIISRDLKTDFDIFFPLKDLLRYKKIGKKK